MIHKTAKNEEVQGYGLPKVSLQNHKKNLKFKHFKGVKVVLMCNKTSGNVNM